MRIDDLVAHWVALPSTAPDWQVIERWRCLLAECKNDGSAIEYVESEFKHKPAVTLLSSIPRRSIGLMLLGLTTSNHEIHLARWYTGKLDYTGYLYGFVECNSTVETVLWRTWSNSSPIWASIAWGLHPSLSWTAGLEPYPWTPLGLAAFLIKQPIKLARDFAGTPILYDAALSLVGRLEPWEVTAKEPLPSTAIGRVPCRLHMDGGWTQGTIVQDEAEQLSPRRDLLPRLLRSVLLEQQLGSSNLPLGTRAWFHAPGRGRFLALGIYQRYPGMAKQVAAAALGTTWGRLARWIVIVDGDIDVSDLQDVMWAVCTRADPQRALTWITMSASGEMATLLIDACWPFSVLKMAPRSCATDSQVMRRAEERWGELIRRHIRRL